MAETVGFAKVKCARSAHRCTWCGQQIEIGQPYEKWCWKDGGDFGSVKMHPECSAYLHSSYDDDEFTPYDNPRPQAATQAKEEPRHE